MIEGMGDKAVIAIICAVACLFSAAIGLTVGLWYGQAEVSRAKAHQRSEIDSIKDKMLEATTLALEMRARADQYGQDVADQRAAYELELSQLTAELTKERKRVESYSDALHELRSSLPSTYRVD